MPIDPLPPIKSASHRLLRAILRLVTIPEHNERRPIRDRVQLIETIDETRSIPHNQETYDPPQRLLAVSQNARVDQDNRPPLNAG